LIQSKGPFFSSLSTIKQVSGNYGFLKNGTNYALRVTSVFLNKEKVMFKKIKTLRSEWLKKGELYFTIGKDIFDFGKELIIQRVINRRTEFRPGHVDNSSKMENLKKKFVVPESDSEFENARLKSMSDHESLINQRKAHSEKINSNMSHRNYENHQGI